MAELRQRPWGNVRGQLRGIAAHCSTPITVGPTPTFEMNVKINSGEGLSRLNNLLQRSTTES
jgi:hypothetical protein